MRKVLSVFLLCLTTALVALAGGKATVSTLDQLQSALADSNVDTVVVTKTINITSSVTLNGQDKIIRVEEPYCTPTGMAPEGDYPSSCPEGKSDYGLFYVGSGGVLTLNNMTLWGGWNGDGGAGCVNIGYRGHLIASHVTFTRSYRGICIGNDATAKLVNCNVVRNVCRYGAGITTAGVGDGKTQPSLIMDNCSLSENRTLATSGGGGAIEVRGVAYLNNVVISNNSSSQNGGAINAINTKLYMTNCTVTGNVTTDALYRGGGIIAAFSALYAVNTIFTDNYYDNGTSVQPSDISWEYNGYYGAPSINLINSVYSTVVKSDDCNGNHWNDSYLTTTNCRVATSSDPVFAGYRHDGVVKLSSGATTSFRHPVLVRALGEEFGLFAPEAAYCSTGGTKTYFDCSDMKNIKMGYYDGTSIVKFGAFDAPVEADSVPTYYEGGTRSAAQVGASGFSDQTYYTAKLKGSYPHANHTSVSGLSIFGDTYPANQELNVSIAFENNLYRFLGWVDADNTTDTLYRQPSFSFDLIRDVTFLPVVTKPGCSIVNFTPDRSGTSVKEVVGGEEVDLVDDGYHYDSIVVIKAVQSDSHYDFVGWYDADDNLISTDNPYTFTMGHDPVSFYPKFEWGTFYKIKSPSGIYLLEVNAQGQKTSIDYYGYRENAEVKVTAVTPEYHRIRYWADAAGDSIAVGDPLIVTMAAHDTILRPVFALGDYWQILPADNSLATITADGDLLTINSTMYFPADTAIVVTALEPADQKFRYWANAAGDSICDSTYLHVLMGRHDTTLHPVFYAPSLAFKGTNLTGERVGSDTYHWGNFGQLTAPAFASFSVDRNSSSAIDTLVLTPDEALPYILHFDWWVSSESGWDKMSVTTLTSDGNTVVVDQQSGEESGSYASSDSITGTTKIALLYTKDSSAKSGYDRGFIYNIWMKMRSKTFAEDTTLVAPSYTWRGKTLTETGVYHDSILYPDNDIRELYTLNLTLIKAVDSTENALFCEGDAYLWHSMSLTEAGVYRDTLRDRHANDSIRFTLNLVKQTATDAAVETATFCEGDAYLWRSMTLTEAGTYRDTLRYTTGCDSVRFTLNLVKQTATDAAVENATFCEGDAYLWRSMTLTEAGTYRDTLRYTTGCDSIRFTLHLVKQSATTAEVETAFVCEGDAYTWHGMTLYETDIYRDTARYATGCDSVYYSLHLVKQTSTDAEPEEDDICAGVPYLWHGMTITTAGLHRDTARYASGCDSVYYSIFLSERPVEYAEPDTVVICKEGAKTFKWHGQPLSETGIYYDTLRYAAGCDSLIYTLHYEVTYPTNHSKYLTIDVPLVIMYDMSNIVVDFKTLNARLAALGLPSLSENEAYWYEQIGDRDEIGDDGFPVGNDQSIAMHQGFYTTGQILYGTYYIVVNDPEYDEYTLCGASFVSESVSLDVQQQVEARQQRSENAEEERGQGYDLLGRPVDDTYRGIIIYRNGDKKIN